MSRVLMIHFSHFPSDVRIRREAETMLEDGLTVDTICLRPDSNTPGRERACGVNVHRINLRKRRGSKLRYLWEYTWFGLVAFILTTVKFFRRRYDIIHVHNMPNVLVFCALIPRLFGAKILLDMHDPVPEVFMAKYNITAEHRFIRLLIFLEKISVRFANHVITPNIAFRNLFIERGCPPEKIGIVMNTPMERLFNDMASHTPAQEKAENQFIVMYHGTIVERHGLLEALEAVDLLRTEIPGLRFHVYGHGDSVASFENRLKELNLEDVVTYHGRVTNQEIARAIGTIDLGIIPNRKGPFTDLNFPVRIFEYLALKKPLIVPRTPGILDYFDEDNMEFFEAGNVESLAAGIRKMYQQPCINEAKMAKAVAVYDRFRWEKHRYDFLKPVRMLLNKPAGDFDNRTPAEEPVPEEK